MYSNIWARSEGLKNRSLVSQILQEPTRPSLEKLFKADDLISKCIVRDKNLEAFLCDENLVNQILDYLLLDPAFSSDRNRVFEFPFLCNKIVTSRLPKFIKFIGSRKALLQKVFGFLRRNADSELNSVLAGYFKNLFEMLMDFAGDDVLRFVEEDGAEAVLGLFVDNIDNESVRESLIIFGWPSNSSEKNRRVLAIGGVIQTLVGVMEGPCDEKRAAAGKTVLEMAERSCFVKKMRFSAQKGILFNNIESESIVNRLLEIALSNESDLFALKVLLCVMQKNSEILKNANPPIKPLCGEFDLSDSDSQREQKNSDPLGGAESDFEALPVAALLDRRAADLAAILRSASAATERKALAMDALSALLAAGVFADIALRDAPAAALALALAEPWQTKLLLSAERLLGCALRSESLRVKRRLFKGGFAARLREGIEAQNAFFAEKGCFLGNCGFLYKIGKMALELSEKDETISSFIKADHDWDAMKVFLNEHKKRHDEVIGLKAFEDLKKSRPVRLSSITTAGSE